MAVQDLEDKKILILGFGREGRDTYGALRELFPDKELGIGDEKELRIKKAKLHLGKDYLKAIKDYDVIIRSPGVPRGKVEKWLGKNQVLTSQTQLFFDNCPSTIIGVTGTKGKGTTSTLIYEILKQADRKVHLVGNIGKPVFQTLLTATEEDIFVYELSSHQLDGLQSSPHIAVFLNLFPDHLDYFDNFKDYQRAKENILLHQTENDFVVYNADDEKVKQLVEKIVKKTKAQKYPFSLSKKSYDSCLKGDFNKRNIMAAVKVGEIMKVSEKESRQGIKDFKGMVHRLEFVGEYRGIKFYNDSAATIPQATIAALNAFQGKVGTLLVGGSDKGSDYRGLAETIAKQGVGNLIILGRGTGEKIWKYIQDDFIQSHPVNSMEQAVKIAFSKTDRGEVCLLSPASASFNLFSDYRQRGNLFKEMVRKYGRKKEKNKN